MKQFQNNSDFDDFLRNKLNQSAINPPNGQWEAINRILVKKRRQKWAFRLSAAAILLLILYQTASVFTPIGFDMPEVALSGAPYRSLDEKSEVLDNNWKKFNKEVLPQTKAITQDINLALVAEGGAQSTISGIEDKRIMSKGLAAYVKVQPIKVPAFLPKKMIPPLPNKQANKIVIIDLNSQPIPSQADLVSQHTIAETPAYLQKKVDEDAIPGYSDFYIGIGKNINSTWLLNANHYRVFGGSTPNSNLSFGSSWGMHIGWNPTASLSIELEANMLAKQGQKYSLTLNGRTVSQEIELVYHQWPLVFKKKQQFHILGKKFTGYLEGGIQYSQLLLARQTINSIDLGGIYTRFSEQELSILAGYSLDWPISKRVWVNTGFRVRLGENINAKGWESSNDGYKGSHNLDLGMSITLNYHLFSHKK